mgnify:FL=1
MSNGYLSIRPFEARFENELPEDACIECIIIIGSQTMVSEAKPAGTHSVTWHSKLVGISMQSASNIKVTVQLKGSNQKPLGTTKIPLDSIVKGFAIENFPLLNDKGAEVGKIYLEIEYLQGIPMSGMTSYIAAVNKSKEEEFEKLDEEGSEEDIVDKKDPKVHHHEQHLHGLKSDNVRGMVTKLFEHN